MALSAEEIIFVIESLAAISEQETPVAYRATVDRFDNRLLALLAQATSEEKADAGARMAAILKSKAVEIQSTPTAAAAEDIAEGSLLLAKCYAATLEGETAEATGLAKTFAQVSSGAWLKCQLAGTATDIAHQAGVMMAAHNASEAIIKGTKPKTPAARVGGFG